MTRSALYSFLTGVYFALLQFSYFLVLQINISSTYLTYMLVVIAWMTGAVTGLWWRRLDIVPGIISGLLCYYLAYALIVTQPLAWTTLAAAAAGVWVAGLWAGRFFLAALPMFRRSDALFFHENNGFLVGVVSVFLGFTTIGRTFLFAAPLAAAVLTLAVYWWCREGNAAPAPGTAES
jgi:hypothetical protein